MENHKGKSKMSSFSDNDQVIKIDLTLKLGLSIHDREKLEEEKDGGRNGLHGFSNGQTLNVKGKFSTQARQENGNVEFSSSSSTYGRNEVDSTNFSFYQGYSPQNLATPTRKRPNIDGEKICNSCGANNTPLWRKGPDGPQVSFSP
ncbi:hypothetical protein Pfo_017723 [Paulownia fortunei]|nr:hypothetical protein Pfo_017723 [Paulownia fortunei]